MPISRSNNAMVMTFSIAFECHRQHASRRAIHCGFAQLIGAHFAKAFEAAQFELLGTVTFLEQTIAEGGQLLIIEREKDAAPGFLPCAGHVDAVQRWQCDEDMPTSYQAREMTQE